MLSKEYNYRLEKAKKLIAQSLKDTLLDNENYQTLKFTDLDSSFSNCLSNKDYVSLLLTYYDITDSFDLRYDNISKSNIVYKTDTTINLDTLLLLKYLKNIDSLGKEMSLLCESFKNEFNGWTISNQLEVKNALNTTRIINATFYFDTSISKIIQYFDDYQANEKYKNFKHKDILNEIFRRHVQYRSLKL